MALIARPLPGSLAAPSTTMASTIATTAGSNGMQTTSARTSAVIAIAREALGGSNWAAG